MTLTLALRTLVGSPVTVETSSAVMHGVLWSCTRDSLWLVAGDDDLMVPLPGVRSVTPD
jgi:hypothetical protein